MILTPTEFFDQFVNHPRFPEVVGRMPLWCARHWAPCPAMDANGMGVSMELSQIFFTEIAGNESDANRLNAMLEEFERPLCCQLGDERMFELWGEWG